MDLPEAIQAFRAESSGINPPADAAGLAELERVFGPLPHHALTLYRDHNGSQRIPHIRGRSLAARLMPVQEAITTRAAMLAAGRNPPAIGPMAWLWTDDNSNYCGVCTEGPLRGWLCIFDHEEPMLTPAFRSIPAFLSRLLSEARRQQPDAACDLPSLPRDLPESVPHAAHAEPDAEPHAESDPESDPQSDPQSDQQLALYFRQQHRNQPDPALRRLYALCSMCLTPFAHTSAIMPFLEDHDMRIPEAAVRLLELRQWPAATQPLEQLAREGHPNADSAAMRLLSRMNTHDSRLAIARLNLHLRGPKLKTLQVWTRPGIHLQPPSWP